MQKRTGSFLKFVAIIFLLLIMLCSLGYWYLRNTIYSNDKINFTEENIEEKVQVGQYFNKSFKEINPIIGSISNNEMNENINAETYKEQEGITNILLLGTDGRTLNESSRSDSIIIATLDNNHKKIKYTSIMRDTYVQIKGHGEDKINSAFAYGGAKLLTDTIYRNFNMKIDKYIVVNFWGFEDIVNELGGIDVNIKEYEINEINKYIGEVDDIKSPKIAHAGMQHLDGQQALAYSRIRKVGNGSYERTQRQRTVMTEVGKKIMNINPIQYPNMLKAILPYIKTNVEPIQLMNYAYTAYSMGSVEFEGLQLPANELCEGKIYRGAWVLLADKEQNAKMLNEFIFKDKKYNPNNFDRKQVQWIINEYSSRE
ncbi:LCP family protein [Clostridium sp. YIM B02505]|uniref:LCP family protein n=1 Tax=Clostridium yunnanense TaxID=2800325 RepID=A0ABS1EWA2_9CLOT|nr:LCP family protein [Clostridium yunnanense]MBK1813669.1 LCP family protein [Clostridium yunnanense]